MGRVIVIEFVTLDGVVTDPDGSGRTPFGGWAFRHGPEAVSGDKFRLGDLMDSASLLLGRRTWELFASLWPTRSDDFSQKMNAMQKRVVTSTLTDLSGWVNSTPIDGDLMNGDLIDAVRGECEQRDVIIAGSISVLRTLQHVDAVDQYRLLTFPSVVGFGERLFSTPIDRPLTRSYFEATGAATLAYYDRSV
ncbi:MAG: dihydrofolate reductase family protein [Nakamurella sp.]